MQQFLWEKEEMQEKIRGYEAEKKLIDGLKRDIDLMMKQTNPENFKKEKREAIQHIQKLIDKDSEALNTAWNDLEQIAEEKFKLGEKLKKIGWKSGVNLKSEIASMREEISTKKERLDSLKVQISAKLKEKESFEKESHKLWQNIENSKSSLPFLEQRVKELESE